MMGWSSDKLWSDRFMPTVKAIVGPHLLCAANDEEDKLRATDLMLLSGRDLRVAVRIRRKGYADRFPNEFTIRSSRDSGAKTEWLKIIEGFGDWLFYGHANDDTSPILSRWMLIDLAAVRAHLIYDRDRQKEKRIRFQRMDNNDGTYFLAFDASSFMSSPSIFIACSHPEEMRYTQKQENAAANA